MDNNESILDLISQGITLMKLQNYEAAKTIFLSVVEKNPEYFDAYMHLGDAYVNLNLFDEAINAFSSALIINKNSLEALFSIANVYYLKGDNQNALKFYVKADNAGYHSADMYLIMGNIFYSAGDTIQALRYVSRALKETPLRGELWRQKILLELELNQIDSALDSLDEFESLLPEALDIHELRTQILIDLGKFEDAKKHLNTAIERFPDDMRLRLLDIHLSVISGDSDSALKKIEQIRTSEIDHGYRKQISLELADIYLRKESPEKIVESIQWGLEEIPNDADLLFILLNTYISSLDYNHILEFADKILAIDSIEPSIYAPAEFYRALSLRETGRIEEATAKFKELAKKLRKLTIDNPENTDLFIYRLLTYSALKEYDKALELADYLGKVSSNESDSHAFRSLVYKEMGDEEKANAELEEAMRLNPNLKG